MRQEIFLPLFEEEAGFGFSGQSFKKKRQFPFLMPFLKLLGATSGKVSGKSPGACYWFGLFARTYAQMVAQVAKPSPGMKVLDLAAATGGKSTQLAAYLAGEGLLVSQ